MLRSLTDVLNLYEAFETHLSTRQLDILGELKEYLDLKFDRNNTAHTHLAYPDQALVKFSGTEPDQDAKSFNQLFERKINFALGDATEDLGTPNIHTWLTLALLTRRL